MLDAKQNLALDQMRHVKTLARAPHVGEMPKASSFSALNGQEAEPQVDRRIITISSLELFELARQVLRSSGGLVVSVRGTSMHPFLRDGNAVKLAPICDCRTGDIVLGKSGDHVLLHRVIKKLRNGVVTKGDAQTDSSGEFMFDQDIAGRVIAIQGRRSSWTLSYPCSYLLARGGATCWRHLTRNSVTSSIYRYWLMIYLKLFDFKH